MEDKSSPEGKGEKEEEDLPWSWPAVVKEEGKLLQSLPAVTYMWIWSGKRKIVFPRNFS